MKEDTLFFAKKYLEDLLSFFGLQVDVSVDREEDIIFLDVPSTHLNGFLIGHRAETLRALHNLTFAAVQQYSSQPYRLNIDIANYKKNKEAKLSKQVQLWIKEVKQRGTDKKLKPMNPAERRVVHKLASAEGLLTQSEGEGNQRYVVLRNLTK